MEMRRFSVIGAGQMGSGIAQVAAQSGLEVVLHDLEEVRVQKGLRGIEKNLKRSVEKGRIAEEEMARVLGRIRTTTDLKEAAVQADIVVEAVVENLSVKQEVFRQLDEGCPEHTILASNTSSLPITEIAAVTKRPEKVIGMHFMNPVPVMKLVEVIKGLATSAKTTGIVTALAEKLHKTPVVVNDYPGFVSNRILMPMINEAVYTLFEGVAGAEEIDTVMKLGMSHPMGPLQLADLIGLDVCLAILKVLHEGFGNPKYADRKSVV